MKNKSQPNCHSKILGVIPARYASFRFPGKILAPITGKSLIQHTYENASRCSLLNRIVIATDDVRIYDHVAGFGAEVVMTSISCPTGTDRIIEAIQKNPDLNDADIVVNIQGDEPCIDPEVIRKVAELLINDPQAVMSTAAVKFEPEEDIHAPSLVKCVFDCNFNALYFSRAPIATGHKGIWTPKSPVYRHMGIYCYRKDFLLRYAELPQTDLQKAEDLEQLKVLEHGYRIKVAVVDNFSIGVDLPEDIQKVEQWLCKQNTSS